MAEGSSAVSTLSVNLNRPQDEKQLSDLQKKIRDAQEKLRRQRQDPLHPRRNSVGPDGFTFPKKTSPVKENAPPNPLPTNNSFQGLQDIHQDWADDGGTPRPSIFDPPGEMENSPTIMNSNKRKDTSPLNQQSAKAQKKDPRLSPLKMPKKDPSPPPIVLNDVINFAELQQDLQQVLNHRFEAKLRGRGIELHTKNIEDHLALIEHLEKKRRPFHTYRTSEERTISVVMKGMDPSFARDDIRWALTEQGFSVANLYRLRDFETDKAQPTIFLDLPINPKNRTIYDLKTLLNMRIKIEARRKLAVIVCTRCSQYGHTKKYCHNNACCGRCGEKHSIDDCTAKEPCCPMCSQKHPITYRFCEAYLEEEQKILEKRQDFRNRVQTQSAYRTASPPAQNPWFKQNPETKKKETNENEQIPGFINDLLTSVKKEISGLIPYLISMAKEWIKSLIQNFIPEIIEAFRSALN